MPPNSASQKTSENSTTSHLPFGVLHLLTQQLSDILMLKTDLSTSRGINSGNISLSRNLMDIDQVTREEP